MYKRISMVEECLTNIYVDINITENTIFTIKDNVKEETRKLSMHKEHGINGILSVLNSLIYARYTEIILDGSRPIVLKIIDELDKKHNKYVPKDDILFKEDLMLEMVSIRIANKKQIKKRNETKEGGKNV